MKRYWLLASHPDSKFKILFACCLETNSGLEKSCICLGFRAGACITIQNREFEEQSHWICRLLMSFPWLILVMKYFF